MATLPQLPACCVNRAGRSTTSTVIDGKAAEMPGWRGREEPWCLRHLPATLTSQKTTAERTDQYTQHMPGFTGRSLGRVRRAGAMEGHRSTRGWSSFFCRPPSGWQLEKNQFCRSRSWSQTENKIELEARGKDSAAATRVYPVGGVRPWARVPHTDVPLEGATLVLRRARQL